MKGFISLIIAITFIGFFAALAGTINYANSTMLETNTLLAKNEALSLKRFELEIKTDQKIKQILENALVNYREMSAEAKKEKVKQEIIDDLWTLFNESKNNDVKTGLYFLEMTGDNYNEIYSTSSKRELRKSDLENIFSVTVLVLKDTEIITFTNTGSLTKNATIFALFETTQEKNYFAIPINYEQKVTRVIA